MQNFENAGRSGNELVDKLYLVARDIIGDDATEWFHVEEVPANDEEAFASLLLGLASVTNLVISGYEQDPNAYGSGHPSHRIPAAMGHALRYYGINV